MRSGEKRLLGGKGGTGSPLIDASSRDGDADDDDDDDDDDDVAVSSMVSRVVLACCADCAVVAYQGRRIFCPVNTKTGLGY